METTKELFEAQSWVFISGSPTSPQAITASSVGSSWASQ